MSKRIIRKLRGDTIPLTVEKGESDLDDDSLINSDGHVINRFGMLDQENSDTEAKDDDDDSQGVQIVKKVTDVKEDGSFDSIKRKKKKKKKNKVSSNEITKHDLDDEVWKLETTSMETFTHTDTKAKKKSLLQIENRLLNPDNEMKRFFFIFFLYEMKRIFGSKVVQSEQNKKRTKGRSALSRSWTLANPRNWQNIPKPNISMEISNRTNDEIYFNYVHARSYQQLEYLFLDAVESYNPDNLVAILNANPNHINSLVQFSDVIKAEDIQMASELIERALYCFESTFHVSFDIAMGNCRMSYKHQENRSFYIALFKHMLLIGQRGCYRTALEFAKLILSLDPTGDPLAIILLLDFYAIQSAEYDYIVAMYNEWGTTEKLSYLPNFRFSLPLALFLKSRGSDEKLLEEADTLLQSALLAFPSVLTLLLQTNNVEPDKEIANCSYFFSANNNSQALNHLIALYVGRCHLLWKEKDTMLWLEKNVRSCVRQVGKSGETIKEERPKQFDQGTPRNVLRHIILSGIKEATITLPSVCYKRDTMFSLNFDIQDITRTPIYGFDPLPPLDSVESYKRPLRHQQRNEVPKSGLLSVFLRSWLPDFNIEEQMGNVVNVQPNQAAAGENPPVAGAEGVDFRRSVTSLMDAMRDLLNNVNPVDMPNDGDVETDTEQQ